MTPWKLMISTLLYATPRYATLRYFTLLYTTIRYYTLLYATIRYSALFNIHCGLESIKRNRSIALLHSLADWQSARYASH
jgi:hypothetical protein